MNFRAPNIAELSIDVPNSKPGDRWVIAQGLVGSPGLAMGVMGLTYTQPVADKYFFRYQTNESVIKQAELL
jgi:hypothetical protein